MGHDDIDEDVPEIGEYLRSQPHEQRASDPETEQPQSVPGFTGVVTEHVRDTGTDGQLHLHVLVQVTDTDAPEIVDLGEQLTVSIEQLTTNEHWERHGKSPPES